MYLLSGWRKKLPPQPWHDPDEAGWDFGLIVQYWSTQSDNLQLSTVELGYKALSLFAVSVYRCVSDLARLARDHTHILATAMRYRYFGTKELRSVLSSLGKAVYLVRIVVGYVRSWLCRFTWIVPQMNYTNIPI